MQSQPKGEGAGGGRNDMETEEEIGGRRKKKEGTEQESNGEGRESTSIAHNSSQDCYFSDETKHY